MNRHLETPCRANRAAVLIVLAVSLLAACSGASDPAPTKTKGATTTSIEKPWREAAAGDKGKAFLASLSDVGPGPDSKSSLTQVVKTCLDIWEGRDAVVTSTARFSGPEAGVVTKAQAKEIVKAAQKYICTDL